MAPGKRGGSSGLVGECKACKVSKAHKPKLDNLSPDEIVAIDGEGGNDSEEEAERPTNCCMRRLLSSQSDFKNEQSLLYKAGFAIQCNQSS